MRNLKVVFSSDVQLHSDSIQALKSLPRVTIEAAEKNQPMVIHGTVRGKALTIRGSRTTETKANNTVAGYEPTNSEPFEFTMFDGDVFRWASGSVMSFQYITIKR